MFVTLNSIYSYLVEGNKLAYFAFFDLNIIPETRHPLLIRDRYICPSPSLGTPTIGPNNGYKHAPRNAVAQMHLSLP